jgi:hypothetical protein
MEPSCLEKTISVLSKLAIRSVFLNNQQGIVNMELAHMTAF